MKILVFSTETISDPGIDFAGSSGIFYPSFVHVISVPCSSGIHPNWIVFALKNGYDGVFIAADGEDCPFLKNCTARTAEIVKKAQEMLKAKGIDPSRVRMAGICSVCGDAFASHMEKFAKFLKEASSSA